MKSIKKSKSQLIQEAVALLNKAERTDEPHLQIRMMGGLDPRSASSKELVTAIRDFVRSYKKFYDLKQMEVEFIL